jgi:cobalt/nickel transport system ATP-binding protein
LSADKQDIYVRDLSYNYPDGTMGLDHLSLEVSTSSRLLLAGPNGSGKTTLLLHLNGLLDGPGEIRVAGLERSRRNIGRIRKKIGYLFSHVEYQFIMPDLLNDVMLGVPEKFSGDEERKAAAMQWLRRLGLADYAGRSPLDLSSGEMKKAALAGILVREPEVILMDEPLNNLDRGSSMALLDILSSLPQTMVIATHRRLLAERWATDIAFIKEGRITEVQRAQEALSSGMAAEILF